MSNESSAGLREKSVGLRGDWIASITNVAPTAATTLTMAALIAASGLASPLAMLVAGAAMLCCAVAYHRLNAWQASAEAPVKWVARGLSPILGFAVGILAIAVIGVKVTIRFEGWVILIEYMIILSLGSGAGNRTDLARRRDHRADRAHRRVVYSAAGTPGRWS